MRYISSRPTNPKDTPTWYLGLVSMALPHPPMSLCKTAIADLTLKPYFLILLASERRWSDLLAIDLT